MINTQSGNTPASYDAVRTQPTAQQEQRPATAKCSVFAFLIVIILAFKYLFGLRNRAQPNTTLHEREIKKVVVIGAGPIGISTAIQIQKKYPATEIVVLEKYDEYAETIHYK